MFMVVKHHMSYICVIHVDQCRADCHQCGHWQRGGPSVLGTKRCHQDTEEGQGQRPGVSIIPQSVGTTHETACAYNTYKAFTNKSKSNQLVA